MQRSPVIEASTMAINTQPIVSALYGLQRHLFDQPYVSDLRTVNGIRAKDVAWQLGDDVNSGLVVKYMSHVIKIEHGRSWSKMFGNFMGTAAAFRTMLDTAWQDRNGFVGELHTDVIKNIFLALMTHRKLVKELAGSDVSRTMQLSAAYCSKLVDELHELYCTSEQWAVILPDGETVHTPTVDRKALKDPESRGLPVTGSPEGSVVLLTSGGLEAFKAWAVRATEPNNFLESIEIPVEARVGERHTAVIKDRYGKTGGLPVPHPSYASPVHRVLVELMGIVESLGMPEIRFRANGWRNGAYEAQVPTEYAQRFLDAVGENKAMGSLRGEHDWWLERIGEQVKVVIPTQPAIHMQHFVNFSKSLMEKVAMLYNHFQKVCHQEEIDLDAPDKDEVSIRMKLNEFEAAFQELEGMRAFLEAERNRDPNLRTQESLAVSALIQRLMFLVNPYRDVYLQRDETEKLASNIGLALNTDVFNLLEHMPDHNNEVPRVDVFSTGPKIPFTPNRWVDSYMLLIKLYERIVEIAGAFDEDHGHPVNVEVSFSLDVVNSRIKFSNPDGRLIDYFRGFSPDMASHLIPGPLREIFAYSRRAAPEGQAMSVIPDMNLMYFPIQIQGADLVDMRGVPQSPSMARFSRPHPSLLKRTDF